MNGSTNGSASDEIYFERLRKADEELERQGVPVDEKLYQGLIKLIHEHEQELRRRASDPAPNDLTEPA